VAVQRQPQFRLSSTTAHGLSLLERGWLISNFWVLVVVVAVAEKIARPVQSDAVEVVEVVAVT
jgi:hypothetical protein